MPIVYIYCLQALMGLLSLKCDGQVKPWILPRDIEVRFLGRHFGALSLIGKAVVLKTTSTRDERGLSSSLGRSAIF